MTPPVIAKAATDVQNSWTATLRQHKEWDFSLHDVGDIVRTIQNNRGLFVEHDI